jgi:RNA polymerase sigma factor (sigma-70 family)
MEASALTRTASSPQALLGRTPLLRLQGDERLVAMTRRGHPGAFDALVHRYQARLHSFCRHMLGSTEDAEDVLQEVFASAYNAMLADDRPINVRPWLYRIARNRSLNHLRRPQHAGQDSMDVFERAGGETTADAVHRREDFRLLIADVQGLPESQRTALLMREIDALRYEQIAEAMETTVPSVKSLLVRARMGLTEAAEARMLSCDDVRLSLAEAAEGITKASALVRRHVKGCERCRVFRVELRRTTRALAAVYPVGPLVIFQKLVWGKLGLGSGSSAGGAGGSGAVGGSTVAGGSAWGGGVAASGSTLGGGLLGGSAGAGGVLSTGIGAIVAKAAVGLVAAAVVTAGAVEIKHRVDAPAASEAPAVGVEEPREAASASPDAPEEPAGAAADETVVAAETPAAEPATTPTEETAVAVDAAEAAPSANESSSLDTSTDGGGSGSDPLDGSGSDPSSDVGRLHADSPEDMALSDRGDDGSSPPSDGSGGGEPSSPPPPAPPGEPKGSSTGATPKMQFGAGEPAGARSGR